MKADGTIYVDTAIDIDGFKSGSRDLETAAKKVAATVEGMGKKIEISVQKSVNAFVKQNQAVYKQQEKVKALQKQLESLNGQKVETDAYREVNAEIDKLSESIAKVEERKQKFLSTGGDEASKTFQKMEYDTERLQDRMEAALEAKKRLESSGGAYQPVDTSGLESKYSAEADKLSSMNNSLATSYAGLKQKVDEYNGSLTKTVSITAAIKKGVSSIASWLKTCVTRVLKFALGGKSSSKSFQNIGASLKRIAPAMLAVRGVVGILRKAVDAYLQQNQQLSNTLSGAWINLGNILGPIITKVVNLVATAIAYVTKFLNLFGLYGASAKKELNGAGGAAKKASNELKKYITSFDELITIGEEQDDGGGGSGADASGFTPNVTLPDWAVLVSEQVKASNWSAAAKTLSDALTGMINSVNWDTLGDRIGRAINGAIEFLYSFVYGFDWKNLAAKLASGVNGIVKNINGIQLGALLASKFKIAFDFLSSAIINLDMGQLAETASDMAIGFFDAIGETINGIDWGKVGEQITEFLVNVDWAGVVKSVAKALGAALVASVELIKGLIKSPWDAIVSWWKETAYEDGKFTFEGLLQGIQDKVEGIETWLWEHIFEPFITGFKNLFGINSPSTVMADLGGYLSEGLLNGISEAWVAITGFLSESLDGIKKSFTDAWDAVTKATSTAWNGFIGIIKGAINGIIDAINSMISSVVDGMNGLLSGIGIYKKLPDWMGGYEIDLRFPTITAPQIPRLAKGAVIPPNAPFTAVLGDQRNGTNLEAPEDLIRKIVREESVDTSALEELLEQLISIVSGIKIGDDTIGRAANRYNRTMNKARGW